MSSNFADNIEEFSRIVRDSAKMARNNNQDEFGLTIPLDVPYCIKNTSQIPEGIELIEFRDNRKIGKREYKFRIK